MDNETFVVKSRCVNSKYINIYKEKRDCYEIHITNNVNVDNIVIIDKDDFDKVKKHFWCVTNIGINRDKPAVYSYTKYGRIMLNRLIMNIDECIKIIHVNRNPLDFRKSNLYIKEKSMPELREKSRTGKDGMSNIREIYRNGKLISFCVSYNKGEKRSSKSFNVIKLGGEELALKKAVTFRDSLLEKAVI